MNEVTLVYILGGATAATAALYYLVTHVQRRQQFAPSAHESTLELAGRVYVAGVLGRAIAFVIIVLVVVAYFLWPR